MVSRDLFFVARKQSMLKADNPTASLSVLERLEGVSLDRFLQIIDHGPVLQRFWSIHRCLLTFEDFHCPKAGLPLHPLSLQLIQMLGHAALQAGSVDVERCCLGRTSCTPE